MGGGVGGGRALNSTLSRYILHITCIMFLANISSTATYLFTCITLYVCTQPLYHVNFMF